MPIVRLIYASRFSRGVGPNEVQEILSVSRQKNEEAGLTGILCYDPRYFLQVLEGSSEAVNDLYNEIAADDRHTNVTLIAYGKVSERLFAEWAMAYLRVDDLTRSLLLKYTANGVFDPYVMDGDQALSFVCALSKERESFSDAVHAE